MRPADPVKSASGIISSMPSAGRGVPSPTDSQSGELGETRSSATPTSDLYGKSYYATYFGGAPYERSDHWLTFFGRIADQIVADIAPRTHLDAGCAMGFLVEALHDRGVDSEGVDISEYAISQAREDIRPYVRVASILEPFDKRYDLITCIETLEHLDAVDAAAAVRNLCAHTDDVLFTSTPTDHEEPTHVNVRPPEYWAELFLDCGFVHELDYDHRLANLAPWGMRFRRTHDPHSRHIVELERHLWRMRDEKQARDRIIVQRTEEAAADRRTAEELIAAQGPHLAEIEHLSAELRDAAGQVAALQRAAEEAQSEVEELRAEMARLRSENTYRLAQRLRRSSSALLPAGTRRGNAFRRVVRAGLLTAEEGPAAVLERLRERRAPASPTEEAPPLHEVDQRWNEWLQSHDPDEDDLRAMREASRSWTRRPKVSILMPAYESEAWFLAAAIDSVRAQAYENWELCVADDASPSTSVVGTVARYQHDDRIRLVRRETNGGIAMATQSAADIASGELVALLDHDDLLRPDAVYEMVRHVLAHPDEDFVYSDEDKLDPWGRRVQAHLKPDWSPELLDSCNYISHFTMLTRALFDEAGGFRPGFDGSQDYDLMLRATERARAVGHVAKVLYSWRMIPRSAAASADAKPAAYEAARRALLSSLERRGEQGRVEHGYSIGLYYVRRAIVGNPSIAVVIPVQDGAAALHECVDSVLENSGGRDLRVVLVDDHCTDQDALAGLERRGHVVVRSSTATNRSRLLNAGAAAAGPVDHLVFLDADAVITKPTWLEGLLEQSQRREVGAVGGRVLFADGSVEQEGIRVAAPQGPAVPLDMSDYFGMGRVVRTVSAVSSSCMMLKRSLWDEAGGFDESFRLAYGDVDLCLRLAERGLRNVYTPLAEVARARATRRDGLLPLQDERVLTARWQGRLSDPFVGRHLRSVRPREYT